MHRPACAILFAASRRRQIIADVPVASAAATPRRMRGSNACQSLRRATLRLCFPLPQCDSFLPDAVIPLTPRAADAGVGRARRGLGQARRARLAQVEDG